MSEKWPRYPLSQRLLEAVNSLFPKPEDGLQFLGLDQRVVPGDWYRQPVDSGRPPLERAKELRAALEKHLIQMAAEKEEYDNPTETTRLRSEAVGLLLALHEIWLHFPEVVQDDRRRFDTALRQSSMVRKSTTIAMKEGLETQDLVGIEGQGP